MTSLLDGARRAAYRLAGRARRRLSGGDGGFILLESIIAISLITVIMSAIGAEYVASVASVARQRTAQGAAQVANSTLEQVRALRPSDLVAGRGASSVATQLAQGNAIPTVTPWLQQMDPASDTTVADMAGATATIPTCDPTPQGAAGPAACTQTPGTVAYTVSQFIGTCWLVTSVTSSDCKPAAQKTASSVSYLRVVVSVSWRNGACPAGCYYVTSTLVSASVDPSFKANQPPLPAPVVAPPGNQNNDIGDAVNLQLALVSGTGVPGYTWAITSGSLPSGLTLNTSTGVISGVVTGAAGAGAPITVQVIDGYGRPDTATPFTWTTYNRPVLTAPATQVTAINTAVSLQLAASCPNTPCKYTLTNAPTGLTISTAGLITGTVTAAGTNTVTATVTDAANGSSTATFSWTVLPNAPACVAPVNLANGGFEAPGGFSGAGTNVGNGTSGLVWKTSNANGQIEFWANGGNSQSQNGGTAISAQSGTQWVEVDGAGLDTLYQDLPTTPGQVLQWSLSHRARNATNNVNAQDTMQVQLGSTTQQSPQVPNGATSPTISDGASVWVQYTGTYTVPAGQTTTRFQLTALSTSSNQAGVGNFVDSVAVTGTPCLTSTPANQTSTINAAITPVQMTASQGSGSYTWSGGSTLPAGLTMSSSGLITGTPTTVGTTSVSLIVTDSTSSYQQVVPFTWTVKPAPTVSTPSNQTSSVGAAVSLAVTSSCANNPCTYTLTGGPTGLSINSNGVITGTPTTAGTSSSVTVTIRDAAGSTATSAAFTWTVKSAPTVTAPGNQTSTVGRAVSVGVGSTCPNTACTYALSGAPVGLSINSSGVITGTPTTAGTSSSVTVTITDAAGATATSSAFTWTVKTAPTVTTPGNQTSTVGTPVSVGIGSTCPNTPCTYTLTGAPAGLSINSSGVITGTPTTAGTSSSVTVTITDAAGATATTGAFTWTVQFPVPTIATPNNQATDVGVAVNLTVASTCANSPCTYTLTGAPAGLSISSSSGVITGTPTTPGTSSTVAVKITDAGGATATTANFSWTIYARPTISSPGNQRSTLNTALILPISSTCSNPSCTYALTGAPAGLTINSSTARITGTPTTTGTSSSVKVTVTDAGGVAVDTGTFSWTITAAPSVTSPGNQSTVNNAAVTLTLAKSCPNSPCAYRLNNGPAGLSISTAGVVSGTVTSALRTFSSVSITVTDSSGATATTASFTWSVTAPLVGRWTFDESSGSAVADSSSGGHPATLSGSAGSYNRTATAAQGANAVTMNGTSGTAASTSGPVLNTATSFTVSAWVKLAATSDYSTFVAQSGTNVSGFYLQYNPSSNRFRFYKLATDATNSAGASQSSVAAPVIGQWYQLTGVYDSTAGTISLFVNGVRQGAPVAVPNGFNATGNFTMGAGNFGGLTNWLNGSLDDVRAFSSALSDDAVTQLAQAGYWRFDEGSGTTAQDSSLYGANGTLSGGTSWTTGIVGPSAVQFNGSSGVVTASPNPIDTTQSFAVSAWAKVDSTNSTGAVISADGANVSAFILRQDNNRWALVGVSNDSTSPTVTNDYSSTGLVVGQWYHLVGVYDSVAKTLALYVNGVLQGSPVAITGGIFKASGSLLIGRSLYQNATNYFAGAIDDVHAFRFAMDQAGVNTLAVQTPVSPATPTATAGAASATVTWTAPVAVAGSPVTGYVVTPRLDGVAQTPVSFSSTATSQTLTGLTTGGSYTFSVAAANANGTSASSAESNSVLVS